MNELKEDYNPFGPEWETEMKNLPKAVLIDMIKANKIKETEKFEATEEILVPIHEGISELIDEISFIDGSDRIRLVEAVDYYVKASWDVIENIYSKVTTEEQVFNSVQRLTSLQEELGYKEGVLSTVAILGLVGESGEVLNEVTFNVEYCDLIKTNKHIQNINIPVGGNLITTTIKICRDIEVFKKSVRSGEFKVTCYLKNKDLFIAELADTVYYANIAALNVGVTLFDLCQIAHDKIKRKQAEGGSSEDRKSC